MNNIHIRRPVLEDGVAIHRLVKTCPPLDQNSRYCNLLQASHFRDDGVVAEHDGELVGFITGYRVPRRQQVLFVWQVAVSPAARGRNLGHTMLAALIQLGDGIEYVETTVTPSNVASSTMFERFAHAQGVGIDKSLAFASEAHFEGAHEDEMLYRIGPFAPDCKHPSH